MPPLTPEQTRIVPHDVAVELGRASGESRRRRSEAIRRIVTATRAAQGLPPTVEDNAVLDLVATHLEQAARKAADQREAS